MNRRQLAFVILLNALVSLVIAVLVVWVVELRRPDPEALAARLAAIPGVVEHGLFLGLASTVVIADSAEIRMIGAAA